MRLVAKRLPALLKYLVKIVLKPPDVWREASKLPHSFDLLVPVLVSTMRMAFDNDLLHGPVLVLLVRYAQLVPADDFIIRYLLPLGAADEVLGLEERVPKDFGVGGQNDELVCGHSFPHLVEEGAVVDLAR